MLLLDKVKFAIILIFWYGSNTWNGISCKQLFSATEFSPSNASVIFQGAFALAFAQLFVTGSIGLGALYLWDAICFNKKINGRDQVVKVIRSNEVVWGSFIPLFWDGNTLTVSLLNLLGNVATNMGFFLGSVSLTHLIKSSEPLFTSIYSYIFASEPLSLKQLQGMVLISVGVATASYSDKTTTLYGCSAALASSCLYPLRNVLIKQIVKKHVKLDSEFEKISAIQIFYVISLISSMAAALMITSLHVFVDARLTSIEYLRILSPSLTKSSVVIYAAVSVCTFFSYNTFSMIVLQERSASSHAIFNILKRILAIVISALLVDVNFNYYLVLGTGLAMVGILLCKS